MSAIYEAMAQIMSEVKYIGKDKQNQQQGFKFRGIDDVYNATHSILAKNGVFITPEVISQEREERVNSKGTVLAFSRVTMRYTFWAKDGSSVACSTVGEGMDSGDKATNKAMAVAHKYAILQTFCIPTEDMPDPDAESHEVQPKHPPARSTAATKDQLNIMFALLGKAGITDKEQGLAIISAAAKRKVNSSKELTAEEAAKVIQTLKEEEAA